MESFDTKIERNTLDNKLKNCINIKSDTNVDLNEYLLNPENNRLTIYPIKNKWNNYEEKYSR